MARTATSHDTHTLGLERRFEALRVRLHYVNRAWTVDNYEALLRFFVQIIPRLLEAERCSVFILERDSGRVISTVGTGLLERQIDAPLDGSIVGRAISSGRCIIENDLEHHSGFHQTADSLTGFNSRSLVCAPIRSVSGSGITGAIEVLNKSDHGAFTSDDGELVQQVADYLSMALENILIGREILKLSGDINRNMSRAEGRAYGLASTGGTSFVAESDAMRAVLDLVRMVSETPVSVVIQGENGTGKEVIARLIHAGGDRDRESFVAVNCAAVPEALIESEFFGYEKGAFTGATGSRAGRFEEADGGTLFLDEVGDMPASMQPKLLRAIQEGEGSRLGSNRVIPYDVRLISASNKSLRTLVETGAFREDLYYRLFAIEIVIPPLRERREDVAPLALAFLDEVCRGYGKVLPGFTNDLLTAFEGYPWPGNVRQLRREVERLVALTPEGQHLSLERCSPEIRDSGARGSTGSGSVGASSLDLPERIRALEADLIAQALDQTGGNRSRAAGLLGITRQGLHKKLKRAASPDASVPPLGPDH